MLSAASDTIPDLLPGLAFNSPSWLNSIISYTVLQLSNHSSPPSPIRTVYVALFFLSFFSSLGYVFETVLALVLVDCCRSFRHVIGLPSFQFRNNVSRRRKGGGSSGWGAICHSVAFPILSYLVIIRSSVEPVLGPCSWLSCRRDRRQRGRSCPLPTPLCLNRDDADPEHDIASVHFTRPR